MSVKEALLRYYGHQGFNGNSLYEMFRDSPIHHPARGPRSTDHRMISEDIPYGLVPYTSFAELANVPTPTMDALITIASVINQVDYLQTGRTVESLGLSGYTPQDLIKYVNNGPG